MHGLYFYAKYFFINAIYQWHLLRYITSYQSGVIMLCFNSKFQLLIINLALVRNGGFLFLFLHKYQLVCIML